MNSAERREARYQRRKAARMKKKAAALREYGDFETVFSFERLYESYRASVRGVGWKASTQRYKAASLANVTKTHEELIAGRYRSKGFYEFDIVERGKPRHIRSVHISERVVQRCLCDYCLVPMLSRSFIYDNGASLRGKGYDFAVSRVTHFLAEHYRKHGREGYVLVFDFSKYFDTAQHEPVFREFERSGIDDRLVALSKYFIQNFGDVGLGLGSQVSQIAALALPNRIDHYNLVEFTRALMEKYNIPAENVVRHYDVTGKWCPRPWMGDDMNAYYGTSGNEQWARFKARLSGNEEVFDMDINEARKQLTSCADTGDTPSAWAKEAAEYCKRKGIFNGDGAGNFGWQQPITREAVACIIYRALEAAGALGNLSDV